MKSMLSLFHFAITLLLLPAAGAAEESYVAHEWGTFTSVQGSDGVPLRWRAAQVSELPNFVHSLNAPKAAFGNPFSKNESVALQRMETPVVYFYPTSSHRMKVKTAVSFPHGLVTEWYPQASQLGPFAVTNVVRRTESGIEWNVELDSSSNPSEPKLAIDQSGSHYFAARETDAAVVRVDPQNQAAEFEKFLFYRGIGFFAAPLRVLMARDGSITVTNTGSDVLKHLFVLRVSGGKGTFDHVSSLKATEQKVIVRDAGKAAVALDNLSVAIGNAMSEALQGEGLYRREAIAMVNTWKDSWFAEDGVRVLYILPRRWTDAILPIQFHPAPKSLERVMVGRAEIIPPEVEQELRVQLVKASGGDSKAKDFVSRQLTHLGRFADPAVQVAAKGLDQSVVGYALNAAALAERTGTP
jgi:hypothetical protein